MNIYSNNDDMKLSELIQQAEARFANFEVTTSSDAAFPSAYSGGTWAKASPQVLEVIRSLGFNLIGWANNHTLDFLYQGIIDTRNALDDYGFIHAGVGNNLAEACKPRYLECESGRVAIIAATSTFHESWIAGEQRPDITGRPGVNPLRFITTYDILPEKISFLKALANQTGINAKNDLAIEEGYKTPAEDGVFFFGNHRFREAKKDSVETRPCQKDMQRIIRSISEAKRQADYVLVSIHSHEMLGKRKEIPADFLKIFARKCIDEGASAVIGHGPHLLRGIEIYKNHPIFYSLGNFIFQNETINELPSDFYEMYGLGLTENVADALDIRSCNDTKGLGVNSLVWESVIACWVLNKDGLKELLLYPIELGFSLPRYQRGWPKLSNDIKPLERLKELSLPFGTDIEINGSIGKVLL